MITSCRRREGSKGSSFKASAMFVRGPSATTVSAPSFSAGKKADARSVCQGQGRCKHLFPRDRMRARAGPARALASMTSAACGFARGLACSTLHQLDCSGLGRRGPHLPRPGSDLVVGQRRQAGQGQRSMPVGCFVCASCEGSACRPEHLAKLPARPTCTSRETS